MKQSKSEKKHQSFRILGLFCAAVFMLIAISVTIKLVSIIAKSKFDGQHRFTTVFLDKPVQVVSFEPDTNTISILQLRSSKALTKARVSDILHIPIDVVIHEKGEEKIVDNLAKNGRVDNAFQAMVFSIPDMDSDMTFLDVLRVWLFAKSVEDHNIFHKAFTDQPIESIEDIRLDKTVSELFLDQTISDENNSIQVVNASGISGKGNDFARTLTNIGGNVLSVTTAHKEIPMTTITYIEPYSYTVKKIEQLVGKKAAKRKKQAISDIIVTIGKDRGKGE